MSTRVVTSQAELDAALTDDDVSRVLIDSPEHVAIRISTDGGKTVRVDGSARVVRVDGSARVRHETRKP